MMNNFAYLKAGSLAEAVKALTIKGARLHAGGTDLLGCLRDGVDTAERVVSISGLTALKGIAATSDGGVKIGAVATLAEVAASSAIATKYSALSQAAAAVATPQIREQGTIGGNLCQRPRCWYFRDDLKCFKKGGATCYAMGGENQFHAIIGGGPCFCVHPSDVAVALVAFDARLAITGPSGNRIVEIEKFFVAPSKAIDRENLLKPGEIVTHVQLPPPRGEMSSAFRKVRTRGSWDFAQVSVAVALQFGDAGVSAARLALGGVAPYPWRDVEAEKLLIGKKPDATTAAAVAVGALSGANPLKQNSYKVDMAKGAIVESLLSLA